MLKNTFKIATLLCATLTICNVAALAPQADRAVIQYMSADILLPDNSLLNVDMSFDCGSDFSKTAMIITSDAGAHLLATAFASMYGNAAGDQVLHSWNTKVNESDPRKPTFLVVTPPENAHENWYKSTISKGVKKTLNYQAESLTSEHSDDLNVELPIVKPYCGSRDHRPTSAQ
ncbi:hypothetical protein [Pseudoalteromonas rhizosphaerae]|uniref:hypothetical protein n=1 Tax=Pseudoalteromonas rhizosphaerae TaxID=2518973 RepID=UPI002148CAED|nr:hypothetical protein [Pseudoalteromonas rhizosphaerae]